MAFRILRDVSSAIRSSKFCTIMVDEITDISNKEQVVLCLRWVDAGLEAHEDFIGLYEVESTHSAVLLQDSTSASTHYEGSAMMEQHQWLVAEVE